MELNDEWRTKVLLAAYYVAQAWQELSDHTDACEHGCADMVVVPDCENGLRFQIALDECEDQIYMTAEAGGIDDVRSPSSLARHPSSGIMTAYRKLSEDDRLMRRNQGKGSSNAE